VLGRITAKLNQAGFVRMQRQRELFHSLPHIRQEASGFTFVPETDDDIIGVAHYDDLTPGMALAPPVCPEIEDVMEVDISQQWRGNRPLWGVPASADTSSPSSITPAFSHLRTRRFIRRSPMRCSTKRISHS
jgi:hypothetical protein